MSLLHRRTLIASAAWLAVGTAVPARAAAVGQRAPDFTLKDSAGHTVRLSDFKGKPVVLEWTNPGCPFVRKHYDSGNMGATQKLARDQGVANAVLMDEDGAVGRRYDAKTTPHLYIIDAQGQLVYAGGIDSIASARVEDIAKATNHVKAALADIAAGRPVATPVTRAYGCSIKYKADT